MTDTSLKDRLRNHSEAFDSLLSLIPAKLYYGEEKSGDQWQRKKQTKEQARAAKRNKLDPDSALNRSAKEVMDERARNKRKAQEMEQSEEDEESNQDEEVEEDEEEDLDEVVEGIEREKPLEGLKKRNPDDEPSKKVKLSEPEADAQTKEEKLSAHQQRKLLKQQKKAERKAEKKKAPKAEKTPKAEQAPKETETVEEDQPASEDESEDDSTPVDDVRPSKEEDEEEEEEEAEDSKPSKDMLPIDVSGLADDVNRSASSSFSTPPSPTFDSNPDKQSAEQASTTTSIASEAAPGTEKSKKIKVPSDTTELRARLAAKIAALRAARKADGPEGTPIRTRQELIESRRKKLAERKAHKKELRLKAKEAEDKKREEALASARNSPLLSFGSPEHDSALNFTFGRVAFADGTSMSHDLSYVKDKSGKKKGPTDPKSALAKLEAQKKRLAALDDDKRKEVLEKETWLAARRKAEGEKVRNDESLLKKAVKRKDKAKQKSEEAWKERKQGVAFAQKKQQQKRQENIQKRKDTKAAGKAGKKKGKSGPTKSKSRPGFEGGGFGKRK
ncbi:hypothetical protein SLS53_002638 [Cytospora paraplurivora]|uniref:Ribosomal RNA-processing protein 14/surfeit locus protein 6 C-terminal domain-containing protein n=1 Tax=Cytospora paraplurivora TaxID=2898453 RepID=A0AAN9UKI3_9PEZI